MAVFPADDNASKYERLSAWHDARKSAVCPSDLRPQTGDDLMDSQTLAGLFGPVGPLPELGTHQKKLIQFLQQFNDTPHERTVWEHFHERRGMSEDSFAMAECRAKAETDCRDVRDYMAKLILPETQVFIKRQGIEPPREPRPQDIPPADPNDQQGDGGKSTSATVTKRATKCNRKAIGRPIETDELAAFAIKRKDAGATWAANADEWNKLHRDADASGQKVRKSVKRYETRSAKARTRK